MSQTQTVASIEGAIEPCTRSGTAIAFSAEAAAGIVHDLGNLIQIASSAINIVARNPRIHTAELEPVIAGAKISLERAGVLVRQTIGSLSDREAALEYVSVAACLSEIEALVRATWDRSIRLDVHAKPDLPIVKCDPLALQNAVLNLLLNARDAMPNGGAILLRADVISLGPGAAGVDLRITDYGVGMKPETIRHAFDPFFTTKCEGFGGVGLPMVERFAHDAGGCVFIESKYGVGTTVTLRLPASFLPKDSLSALTQVAEPTRTYANTPIPLGVPAS